MIRKSCLIGVALCMSAPAFADDAPSLVATFTLADFQNYAPSTALDMVKRIPGFSISNDNDGSRGLGQASGNVLINGQRVSGKSNTGSDVLGRIPAANVERIELLEGALLDIPGLTGQVVNVVAKAGGISGAWNWRARFRENLPPFYDALEASVTGETGALTWSLGIENDPGRGANAGREDLTDGAGELFGYRIEESTFIAVGTQLTGSLNYAPANGHIANFNAELGIWQPEEKELSDEFLLDGSDPSQRLFRFNEDETNQEIGADYEFGLGPGRLKLIGLDRREYSPRASTVNFRSLTTGQTTDASRYASNTVEGESILRTEYGWSSGEGRDWQVSFEGAFNSLESRDAFYELDASGELAPVFIDNDGTRVEETRYEAFLTHNRSLTPNLSLQVSLGAEQSEISLPGSMTEAQSFTRPKGELALSWTASDRLTVNASLKREVGQLDFFDFVSSKDISNDNDTAGNPDIVPQQSWEGELEFETGFGDFGAGTLRLYGQSIEDIIDRIPLGDGSVAPGNLDSATRYGAEFSGTIKLDPLGWTGAEVEAEFELRDSQLTDPVTGETRRINGDLEYEYSFQLRHDIPNTNWVWGGQFNRWRGRPWYRLNQVSIDWPSNGYLWAFIEHKDIFGMTGTIFAGNLLDQDDNFRRAIYTPDRNGTLERVESRKRNFGPMLTLRLKGAF